MNDELKAYKDAVWDYILEHCDITENGSLFVKFHMKNRNVFEKHIEARWKKNYHRIDHRTNFTHQQKEKEATARSEAHTSRKTVKKRRHQLSLRGQREAMAKLKEERRVDAMNPIRRFIHTYVVQAVAQWYNKKKK